jgi:hypothetical protein
MKNKNSYFLLWLLLSSLITFSACEKADLIEPVDDATLAVQEKSTSTKCTRPSDIFMKTKMLIKKPWVFGEVFHENPDIQQVLATVFADLEFTFFEDGSYHIVIPAMDRDEFGTWEFMDNQTKILFNKGTEGEHFVSLLNLNFRNLMYTYDDPDLGPWELHLVPYYARWHKKN